MSPAPRAASAEFPDQAVWHVETKFEDGVIEMVKIIHQFKAVIILRRHRLQRVVVAIEV